MKKLLPITALLWLGSLCGAAENPVASRVAFDAELLRQGIFTYQLSVEGKPVGTAKIEIRRLPSGEYRIQSDAEDFGQRWSSTLKRDFTPLAAELHMPTRKIPYHMSLRYSGKRVMGEEVRGDAKTPVAAPLSGQVIDQRVDWAAMMAAVVPASGVRFGVFDPGSAISPVEGSRKPAEPIDSVMGKQNAIALHYTIRKTDHEENYVVYATESLPRVMLREDMPNDLVATLIAIEN